MRHLMLDLETLGCGRDGAIVTVGVARFDLQSGEVGPPREWYVAFDSDMGILDASTVRWWFSQSDEARRILFSEERLPLVEVLREFSYEALSVPETMLWSKGPLFDERLLREAYERKSLKFPIHYRNSRDVRTILGLASDGGLGRARMPTRGGPKHVAKWDAHHQARQVCLVFQQLRGSREP